VPTPLINNLRDISMQVNRLSDASGLSFPFYNSSSVSDVIPLVGGTALPFFTSAGVQDNIALVT